MKFNKHEYRLFPHTKIRVSFVLFILLFSVFVSLLPTLSIDFGSSLKISEGTRISLKNQPINSPMISNFNNQTSQYLFFIENESIEIDLLTDFSDYGGKLINQPWNMGEISGFAGKINNSQLNLGLFLEQYPNVSVYSDPEIFAQNANIRKQLSIYDLDDDILSNEVIPNTSIAFFDSGVDLTNRFLNSSNLLFWKDLVANESQPIDHLGHGTGLIASVVGNDSLGLKSETSIKYNLSFIRNLNHERQFYPDHIFPGNYKIKLASLQLNNTIQEVLVLNYSIDTDCSDFQIEISQNGEEVEQNMINTTYTQLSLNLSQINYNSDEILDIYISYNISLEGNPSFNINLSSIVWPFFSNVSNQHLSGILPQTEYGIIRIANETESSYLSYLFQGLQWLSENYQLFNITCGVIPFALYDTSSGLSSLITNYMDYIIEETGLMLFVPTGNHGVDDDRNLLTTSRYAMKVGAVNFADQITSYSGMGKLSSSGENNYLDFVAPGGSILENELSILTPITNEIQKNKFASNAITSLTGTSFSTAISAGFYNFFANHYNIFNSSHQIDSKKLHIIKDLFLMSASELNSLREENPYTSLAEENYSPTLNRGGWDIHEGFGRINPKSIFSMTTGEISSQNTTLFNLTSSIIDPNQDHVKIFNLTLESEQMYSFQGTLNETIEGNFDFDLYLYRQATNIFDDPVLVDSSINGAFQDEIFYYTNLDKTSNYYLVVKAINGAGTINLTLTAENVSLYPVLSDAAISVFPNAETNDTLNRYDFSINYTHEENYEASEILLRFNYSSNVYTLSKNFFDNNFTDGCIYETSVYLTVPGNYSFYFSVRVGPYSLNYTDPDINNIVVNSIGKQVSYGYFTNFSLEGENLWNSSLSEIHIKNEIINKRVYAGWDWISSPFLHNEYLPIHSDPYRSVLYCGLSGDALQQSRHHFINASEQPVYSYLNMSGEFSIESPFVYIPSTSNDPYLKMGIRMNLLPEDELLIQIRVNRSNIWSTLESYSGIENNWAHFGVNLSNYKQDFVQIRFLAVFSGTMVEAGTGIMIDYVSIEDYSNENFESPQLMQAYDYANSNIIPMLDSQNKSRFDPITFTIAYLDHDQNYPEYLYLETRNNDELMTYEMQNTHGMWLDTPFSNSSLGIYYSISLNPYDFGEFDYRFRTSDGFFENSTPWYSGLNFTKDRIYSTPLNNLFQSLTLLSRDSAVIPLDKYWFPPTDGWHQVSYLGEFSDPTEIYYGEGNYGGYLQNQVDMVKTPNILLNDTREIFLTFNYRLRFDTGGPSDEEYGEILISSDSGTTWQSLKTYKAPTEGLKFSQEKISLQKYLGKKILLGFRFVSDDLGEQVKNSGWRLKNASIDIDRSIDYDPPVIIFSNLESNQILKGRYNITITLEDASNIDVTRLQVWIGDQEIEYTIRGNEINYIWDTNDFNNGDYQILVIAYDDAGNRGTNTIQITVDNPPNLRFYLFASLGGIILVGGIIYWTYQKGRKQKLLTQGEYQSQPSFFEKREIRREEKRKLKQNLQIINEQIDPEWEKIQPMRLHCKNCKKDFRSPKFEIYCPSCHQDTLYLAKYCPVCERWNYFEEESGDQKCKKCNFKLLKDFSKAKEYLLKEGYDLTGYRATQKEIQDFYKAAEIIPPEQLKELIPELISKIEEGEDQ